MRGINSVGLERRGHDEAARRAIKQAYRILYRAGLTPAQAVERLRAEFPDHPVIGGLADFVAASERGITR